MARSKDDILFLRSVRELVAAQLAKTARDELALPLKAVREIVAVVERGNEDEHRRAELVTFKSDTADGLIHHMWIGPDDEETRSDADALPMDSIVDRATLYEVVAGRTRPDGTYDTGALASIFDAYRSGRLRLRSASQKAKAILREVKEEKNS